MLEHEFILSFSKINNDTWTKDWNLDWEYIFKQSSAHRVAALLCHNIKDLPVPAPIFERFEQAYTYNAFHNLLYMEELEKVIDEFEKHGIKSIVLKGPALAQDVYKNIALRPFSDIDILIHKEDISNAGAILNNLGFKSKNDNFYKKYHFHLPFVKEGKLPVNLELHWALVDQFILNRIDMDVVWKTSRGNRLSEEINIIYLLLHIEKHAFFNKAVFNDGDIREWIFKNPLGNQLIWYTDTFEYVRQKDLDWNLITNLAKTWCVENIVCYNCGILNKLYPGAVPESAGHFKLGRFKKLIYKTAIRLTPSFEVHSELQLRPVRAVDLINYLFPPVGTLKIYYCNLRFAPGILLPGIHFFCGVRNIAVTFVGICIQKLIK